MTEENSRYKADVNDWPSIYFGFAVYKRITKTTMFGRVYTDRWDKLDTFKTAEEAKQYLAKVSELPVYV